MDEMRELVTVEQVDRLFLLLALAAPPLGAGLGALAGMRRSVAGRGAALGFAAGLLGPANLGLWKAYNAITDRLGLDSVANLVVNLALFVVLGVLAGLAVSHIMRQRGAPGPEPRGVAPDSGEEAPRG